MDKKSLWEQYLNKTDFNKLDKELSVDVAIIGGGLTGLSIGYFFKDTDLKTCIFEASYVGCGITSKTTGKITFLQQGILSKIKNIYDEKAAESYYKSQKEAIDLLIKIIKENKIDCDLNNVDSYYFATNKKDIKKIIEEKKILENLNETVTEINSLPDSLEVKYGIKCPNTYIFNPIKYLMALKKIIKKNIDIYENSRVTKIEKEKYNYILYINNHKVKAKKVIIASHYPYFLFPYLTPLKCSLEKSYIGCYQTNETSNFSAISHASPTLSIRYYEDTLKYKLVLTNSHNIAFNQDDSKNFAMIISGKPVTYWSNIDIITKDYMPYIGLIDKDLFIATGYNTWGMTNSTIAGMIIKNLILGRENQYANLFDPNRQNNLKTMIKYPLYGFLNSYSFIKSKLNKDKNLYKDITFKKIDGINVAIYKDEKNVEHIVKRACPHLGCNLLFNSAEKTWDCPCHGSRFDIDGHVLSGPSNYDISVNIKNTFKE